MDTKCETCFYWTRKTEGLKNHGYCGKLGRESCFFHIEDETAHRPFFVTKEDFSCLHYESSTR